MRPQILTGSLIHSPLPQFFFIHPDAESKNYIKQTTMNYQKSMIKHARINTKAIPASLWKRAVAYIIDIAILDLIIAFPFRDHFKEYTFTTFQDILNASNDQTLATLAFALGIFSLLYWVILEYNVHQSLGKMFMNIYVAPQETTLLQIIVRNITKVFQAALFVDVLYMLFKRGHQRLFEIFSRTEVVEYTWNVR